MSYCLNPTCPKPKNPDNVSVCQACGSKLLLRDRYRVAKGLGQGGFGATFLAVDLQLPGNPLCVIKQLRPSTNDPNIFQMARELFEREATTLGKIGNHPQVPRLLDYFEDNKIFYLVQEYVKGNNLQQEIKRNGPVSEAGARQFLSEILPMLQYIHSQKVIHRDIKPANLIRREQDKKLVLIDFGAVKNQVTPQTPSSASDQTALTSFAVGTPGFAPPEQMALRPVFASDIYALGVTCIYLLTGKSPKDLDYDPKTGEMMWQKNVDISENFANVLTKMLEVSVRHRYQTADEVLKALDMEPYLESLAEGLVAKPTGGSGNNLPNSGQDSYDSSPSGKPLSATERLAMAIRNKRNNPNVGSPLGRSGRGSFDTTSTLQTSGRPAKRKVQRLDEEALLNAYVKGRRDFAQQNLSNLNLPEANLAGGIFHQSKLKRSNLQGANLNHADFGRASLVSSNFRDANLGRAYLVGADLEGADLRGADLSYANFRGANLRGANLCGANLTNATITDEQLGVAKTSWTTILPNGKRGFWG